MMTTKSAPEGANAPSMPTAELLADKPSFALLLDRIGERPFVHLEPRGILTGEILEDLKDTLRAAAAEHGSIHVAELDPDKDVQETARLFWTEIGLKADPNAIVNRTDGILRAVYTLKGERPEDASASIVPVVRRATYDIAFEDVDGLTFVHCHVYGRLTPTLWRALRADWDRLRALQGGPLFTVSKTPQGGDVAKHEKFCRKFGFQPYKRLTCHDGIERMIFRSA